MRQAALAAAVTTAACVPRLARWQDRPQALAYLLVMLGLVSFVMWAFTIGWLPPHAGVWPFQRRCGRRVWWLATAGGLAAAAAARWALDPTLRTLMPDEYPATAADWVAATLFHLTFVELFLCFAPTGFFARLLGGRAITAGVVVLFGVGILLGKVALAKVPLPAGLVVSMVLSRLAFGAFTVFLLLRGGVLPVGWWALLFQARLLVGPGHG
jgi:hypothetical protein